METQQLDVAAYSRDNLHTAAEGFAWLGAFLGSIDADAWNADSACSKWTVRNLADHAVGEAVWFPNLVRNALAGEEMYPLSLYEEMKSWPADKIAARLQEAPEEFALALDGADEEGVQREVDMVFAKMPLWQATYVSLVEGVFHSWDGRARLEPEVVIPLTWAQQVDAGLTEFAPMIVHRDALATSSGTYLLQVGDGVGPVTVEVGDGDLSVHSGAVGSPDVTVRLSAEQYARLITGRLPLDSDAGRDRVEIEGDRARATNLNRIFGGIANQE